MFEDINECPIQAPILPIASTTGDEEVCIEVGVPNPRVILVSPDGKISICSPTWADFVQSLSQLRRKDRPRLEVLAGKGWEDVQQFIASGGEIVPPDGLSLLGQAIRVNNLELGETLLKKDIAWGDLDDELEVAVLNNRIEFVKILVASGANVSLAAELAVGPERAGIRAYLERVSG